MKTAGIIVEYNPLHNGHVHHFQETKRTTGTEAVVAVMSGHFLQRGEPAIVNKWARTEMALHMGADLVIELPVAFSSQAAEWFAYGAVTALDRTGVVDCLCFGSESGDLSWMHPLADMLSKEPAAFQQLLRQKLKSGISYPKAYAAAIVELTSAQDSLPALTPEYVTMPNHTLGLHYMIALRRIGSPIVPATIQRLKSDYRQQSLTDSHIASATAIRTELEKRLQLESIAPYLPSYSLSILEREHQAGRGPITWEHFAKQLIHQLVSQPADALAQIVEVTEGLEYRLKQSFSRLDRHGLPSVQQLIEIMQTKRYTRTKVQRMLTRILLSHSKSLINRAVLKEGTPYIRVLGFSAAGRALLKRMKKAAKVPVIVNIDRDQHPLLQQDIQASSVYALAYREYYNEELLREFSQAPIQV